MKALLALAAGLLLAAPSIAQESGEDLFADRCGMCHVSEGKGQGPNLKGVVGRKAGTVPDFSYTHSLKGSGIVWTPDNIDRFISNPSAMIPGTAMPVRVNDPAERAAIIGYLKGWR